MLGSISNGLGNIRIAPKLLTTVLVTALLAAIIAVIAYRGMGSMRSESGEMATASARAVLASRTATSFVNYGRLVQIQTLLDDPALIKRTQDEAAEELRTVRQRLDELIASAATEDGRTDLRVVTGIVGQLETLAAQASAAIGKNDVAAARKLLIQTLPMVEDGRSRTRNVIQRSMARLDKSKESVIGVSDQSQRGVVLLSAVAIVAGLALAIGIAVFGVARPLNRITMAMTAVARGLLDTVIPFAGRRDEVGQLASALATFRDEALEKRRLEAEQARQAAQAEADRRHAQSEVATRFEDSVQGIIDALGKASEDMQSSATSLSSLAGETSRQTTTVASAAEQATRNVEMVATAAEELSASVNEIARQVSQSSTISERAVAEAQSTNAEIDALAASVARIGDVVRLISDIASQTNLLALNATIEAARAGDAGKGFAVVAAEVKNLAAQTAHATEEITGQIATIQGTTGNAVNAIQQIGSTISDISSIASAIASAVEEQGAATQEIARNIQEAAAGTRSVTATIDEVTKGAGETGVAAAQVHDLATDLSHRSDQLKEGVRHFLKTVRAA